MTEKGILQVNAEGMATSCAASPDIKGCGYTDGKVCGKCGAPAVFQQKGEDAEQPIEVKRKKPMVGDEATLEAMPANRAETAHLQATESGDEFAPRIRKKPKMVGDEATLEAMPANAAETAHLQAMHSGDEFAPPEPAAVRAAARKRRIQSMGMKSEDISDDGFLCSIERKMHPQGGNVCSTCPGGCAPEGGLPTIMEIEGIAEEMFGGKVLDSGYGYASDLFLVQMERKDGRVIEMMFDGESTECLNWQLLPTSDGTISQKSALVVKAIGMDDAAELALKSVAGEVVAIDADTFEGMDTWAVEVNGLDGKSYDIYVSLEGDVVGYDMYTPEEAADIDAEAAEIALKRAYPDDARTVMAEAGTALPDGSFPIKDEADLQNAIQAFGRAKDKEAAKAHIMKRAAALKLEDMIPASWNDAAADTPEDAAAEKSSQDGVEDDSFLATLMEFEMLLAETDDL